MVVRFTGCPPDIYRLMCECWAPNPEDRPSFTHLYDRINVFIQVSRYNSKLLFWSKSSTLSD